MNVSVDLRGSCWRGGLTLSWVAICHELIQESGLEYELDPMEQRLKAIGMRCLPASSAVTSACMPRGFRDFMPHCV